MQVPEKLSLIGGSILLASTLVFTLKSQASQVLPKVNNGIGSVYQDLTNTQAENGGMSFGNAYQNAQKQNWTIGTWGSAKYYIDNQGTMHVGQGDLSGKLYDVVGSQNIPSIKTLSFDQRVTLPSDAARLFSASPYGGSNHTLTQMEGLSNVDTSKVQSMYSMFADNNAISNLDLSSWDTHNVNSTFTMFNANTSLRNVNLAHWDTSNLHNNVGYMFFAGSTLRDINLSGWKNLDSNLFGDSPNLDHLTMDQDTTLGSSTKIPGSTWKNGNETINSGQFGDSQPHPGTWIRQ